MTITPDGDILYNHILGQDCSISDSFQITASQGGDSSSKGFPIWLIVLLCILGVIIIGGIAWFCYIHRKKNLNTML